MTKEMLDTLLNNIDSNEKLSVISVSKYGTETAYELVGVNYTVVEGKIKAVIKVEEAA